MVELRIALVPDCHCGNEGVSELRVVQGVYDWSTRFSEGSFKWMRLRRVCGLVIRDEVGALRDTQFRR